MRAQSVGSSLTVVLTTMLLLPVEARSEEQAEVAMVVVGSKVRVLAPTTAPGRIEGILLQMDETSLLVSAKDSGSVRLPRQAITKLDVSIGRRGHALMGMLIGGAIGGAVGMGAGGCGGCSSAGLHAMGAIGGTVGGLVIGALVKSDQWHAVPLQRAHVSLAPTQGRGVALSISVGF